MPSAPYGVDATGLICGFRLAADGKGNSVGPNQALAWQASGEARSLAALETGACGHGALGALVTIVTVMALPNNVPTGLLGMIVGDIPPARDKHGLRSVAAIIVPFTLLEASCAARQPRY